MANVRSVEVKLASLEDKILGKLGYREYSVYVGNTLIEPSPKVVEKPLSSYSSSQIQGFVDKLGGGVNAISTYKLVISRDFSELVSRDFLYWNLQRDGYIANCLPLEISVTDSRIMVTLAVIKVASEAEFNAQGVWNDYLTWGAE